MLRNRAEMLRAAPSSPPAETARKEKGHRPDVSRAEIAPAGAPVARPTYDAVVKESGDADEKCLTVEAPNCSWTERKWQLRSSASLRGGRVDAHRAPDSSVILLEPSHWTEFYDGDPQHSNEHRSDQYIVEIGRHIRSFVTRFLGAPIGDQSRTSARSWQASVRISNASSYRRLCRVGIRGCYRTFQLTSRGTSRRNDHTSKALGSVALWQT